MPAVLLGDITERECDTIILTRADSIKCIDKLSRDLINICTSDDDTMVVPPVPQDMASWVIDLEESIDKATGN